MGCIVIAIPKVNVAKHLREIIKRSGIWQEIVICSKGNETIRAVKKLDTSLVICAQKFSDMGYEELAAYLPPTLRIILLTRDDSLELFAGNIVKLKLPFRAEELVNLLHELLLEEPVKQKKVVKRRSAKDQQIIDQAKALVMQQKDMSEPDAFRYIQKLSMDMGRQMLETAQMILMMQDM